MRFSIKQRSIRSGWNVAYHVSFGVFELEILRDGLSNKELRWTWIDDTQYSLLCPAIVPLKKWTWHICKDGHETCSGTMRQPPISQFFQGANSEIAWNHYDEILVDRSTCCSGDIKDDNGKRIAAWKSGLNLEVVCRYRLQDSILPIVLGMVLARDYDYNN